LDRTARQRGRRNERRKVRGRKLGPGKDKYLQEIVKAGYEKIWK
jgi:hypothetical protein